MAYICEDCGATVDHLPPSNHECKPASPPAAEPAPGPELPSTFGTFSAETLRRYGVKPRRMSDMEFIEPHPKDWLQRVVAECSIRVKAREKLAHMTMDEVRQFISQPAPPPEAEPATCPTCGSPERLKCVGFCPDSWHPNEGLTNYATPASEGQGSDRIFPCKLCGIMRSESEGGKIFTVCDGRWPKLYPPAAPSGTQSEGRPEGAREWLSITSDGEGCDYVEPRTGEAFVSLAKWDALREQLKNSLLRHRDAVSAAHQKQAEVEGISAENDALRQQVAQAKKDTADVYEDYQDAVKLLHAAEQELARVREALERVLALAPAGEGLAESDQAIWIDALRFAEWALAQQGGK